MSKKIILAKTARARKSVLRSTVSLAVVAAGLCAFTSVGAASASAASASTTYGCAGTLDYTSPVNGLNGTYEGHRVGTVYGYWDGTYNCEVFVKSVYVGTKTLMAIHLTSVNSWTTVSDKGSYAYYAGPVKVNGVGSCVFETVELYDPSGNYVGAEQTNGGVNHNC